MLLGNGALKIDIDSLSKALGIPVVGISASTGEGLQNLQKITAQSCKSLPTPSLNIEYTESLEWAISSL